MGRMERTLNKRENGGAAVFCLLAAASVLMICSMNSWLYPLNPWNDVNIFMSVARGMGEGLMPYRDMIEQKGPLLYWLHWLALQLSPGNYHGMYLIETALLAGTLFCFWRIGRLYAPGFHVGWTALLVAAICASRTFRYGDCAEELCLLPMAWSMYALLKSWRTGRPLSMAAYMLHGALAGCILWIKYNQLGLHLVWMGWLAVEAAVRDRRMGRAVRMSLCFLAGMAIASVPWLVQYGLQGALDDLWKVYIVANLTNYGPRNYPFFMYAVVGVLRGLSDIRLGLWMGIAFLGVFTMPGERMGVREKLWIVLAALVMSAAIYGSGLRYVYYFMSFTVFLPFGALLGERLLRPGAFRRWISVLLGMVMLAGGVGYAILVSPNTAYIGYDYEDTLQGQAAALLGSEEDRSVLNVGFMDGGFYFALDTAPPIPWFTLLNIHRDACWQAQAQCLSEGRVKYAVTWGDTLAELKMDAPYEEIAQLESDYAASGEVCRIYRRLDQPGDI